MELKKEVWEAGIPLEEAMKMTFTPEEIAQIKENAQEAILARTLKQERKKQHLTQAQLAKKSGLPRTTISKIERNTLNVTVGTLNKIAVAFGKELDVRFV